MRNGHDAINRIAILVAGVPSTPQMHQTNIFKPITYREIAGG